ncbi:MAG TPA: NAD(P)/FAD-dependent oxidoreductase, partial [Oculatellaceae cyanobacterium]
PLMGWLRRITKEAVQQEQQVFSTSQEVSKNDLTRRDFLKASFGAVLGAAVLTSSLPKGYGQILQEKSPSCEPVVIVGAGLAGLTTAYRLMRQGVPCVLYEASNRLGGRVFTKKHFNAEGMFVELGGELVDTGHTALIDLCGELGVSLESFAAQDEGLEPSLYHSHGKVRSRAEVVEAFVPLVKTIQADLATIFPDGEVQVPTYRQPFNARWVDEMTLDAYLNAKQVEHSLQPWLIDLIKAAYAIEYGLACTEQSALNLLLLIGTEIQQGVRFFGESDEAMRIQGGNSGLVAGLATTLQGRVPIHAGHRLKAVNWDGKRVCLTFSKAGKPVSVNAERVVLAIPLTVLRTVDGVAQLPLSPEKKRFIHELGYGANSKQMIGFRSRFWRQQDSPVTPFTGEIFSDWPSQTYWETSRLQQGRSGILTNFLGGRAGKNARKTQWQKSLVDLAQVFPDVRKQFDGHTAFFNWTLNPFAEGSYSCPKPAQYTAFIGTGEEPELSGRLFFAGEHCSIDSMGYMNGAVESGNQVASAILATLREMAASGA